MYNIFIKYKPQIILVLKLSIVGFAIYFIYSKIAQNQHLSISQFTFQLKWLVTNNVWTLLLLLFFTDVNWFLEIFKWKTLVSVEKKITFLEAYEQCLGSLTASLITPNRIGEYGAKALYFSKKLRKKIMVLNLIGNLSQLTATLFFGSIGMLFFLFKFSPIIPSINTAKLVVAVTIIGILVFIIKLNYISEIKYYWGKIKNYLNRISNHVIVITLLFSILRYVVFSHQFYFLLQLFGFKLPYFTTINLIFGMYFIASLVPSLSIFDWAIKGSVAIWIFSFVNAPNLIIITVTTFMWLLNFAIPALIGSVFVLNFKISEKR